MHEYSSLIHIMVSKVEGVAGFQAWMDGGGWRCFLLGSPLFCAGREKHVTKCLHMFQTLDGDDLCRT